MPLLGSSSGPAYGRLTCRAGSNTTAAGYKLQINPGEPGLSARLLRRQTSGILGIAEAVT
jgi:hypothetical protein